MKAKFIVFLVLLSALFISIVSDASEMTDQGADNHLQEIRAFLRSYLDARRRRPGMSPEEVRRKQGYARELLQNIVNGAMREQLTKDEARSLVTSASVFLRSPLDPQAFVVLHDLRQASEDEVIRRVCDEFIQTMRAGVSLNINNIETVADLAIRYTAGQFESPEYKGLAARILADSGSCVGREFLHSVVANTQIDPAERFRCALSLYAFDPEDNEVLGQMVDLLVDSDVSLNERYRYLVNLKRYGANVSERVVTTAIDSKNDSIRYHIGELLVVSGDVRGIAVAQSIAQNENSEFSTKAQELLSNRISPNLDLATPTDELKWDSKQRVFTKKEQVPCPSVTPAP